MEGDTLTREHVRAAVRNLCENSTEKVRFRASRHILEEFMERNNITEKDLPDWGITVVGVENES